MKALSNKICKTDKEKKLTRMVLCIKEGIGMETNRDLAALGGRTAVITKDSSKITILMEKGFLCIRMEIGMMEIG